MKQLVVRLILMMMDVRIASNQLGVIRYPYTAGNEEWRRFSVSYTSSAHEGKNYK